jgi:hypothetical protein
LLSLGTMNLSMPTWPLTTNGASNMENYQVTYFNQQLGERCVLIDRLDMLKAIDVMAKVSDRKQPFFYMPEVRVEKMKEPA